MEFGRSLLDYIDSEGVLVQLLLKTLLLSFQDNCRLMMMSWVSMENYYPLTFLPLSPGKSNFKDEEKLL